MCGCLKKIPQRNDQKRQTQWHQHGGPCWCHLAVTGVVLITIKYFVNEDGVGVITKGCEGGQVGGLNDTAWSDVWRGQWKNKKLCQEKSNNVQRTANGLKEVFRMMCCVVLLRGRMVWVIFLFYGNWWSTLACVN